MFRYLLALLVLNTYSRGSGNPVAGNLSESLENLAKSCESKLLSIQIRNKLSDCTVSMAPPLNPTQFQCLMFYDINKQLCRAIAEAKIPLTTFDDLDNKTNENIKDICTIAATWNVMDLEEFPFYKTTIPKILTDADNCKNVCGEFMSENVNYFCKYYNWGTAKLYSVSESTAHSVANETNLNSQVAVNLSVTTSEPLKSNNLSAPEIVKPVETQENKEPGVSETENHAAELFTETKQETSNVVNKLPIMPSIRQYGVSETAVNKNVKPKHENIHLLHVEDTGSKPQNGEDSLKNNVENEPEKTVVKPPAKLKEPVLDNPKPNIKIDTNPSNVEYPDGDIDSEEGKDGFEQNLDDGDDPDLADFEQKPPLRPAKIINKKTNTASSLSGDASQRDIFPMIEDFSESNDDNFFPFFLTAVILSVLLYVLYHNKNKVSKVVLGLIVEGRQSGRRRNSRGHAYRRLDTLEQAMSTNTAAAPSRIIY